MFADIASPGTVETLAFRPERRRPPWSTRSCGRAIGSKGGRRFIRTARCTTGASPSSESAASPPNPSGCARIVLIEVMSAAPLVSPAYDDGATEEQVSALAAPPICVRCADPRGRKRYVSDHHREAAEPAAAARPNHRDDRDRPRSDGILILDADTLWRHVQSTSVAGDVVVEDLGSTNGTFLDGTRINAPVVLRAGSVIRVGDTTLELVEPIGYSPRRGSVDLPLCRGKPSSRATRDLQPSGAVRSAGAGPAGARETSIDAVVWWFETPARSWPITTTRARSRSSSATSSHRPSGPRRWATPPG